MCSIRTHISCGLSGNKMQFSWNARAFSGIIRIIAWKGGGVRIAVPNYRGFRRDSRGFTGFPGKPREFVRKREWEMMDIGRSAQLIGFSEKLARFCGVSRKAVRISLETSGIRIRGDAFGLESQRGGAVHRGRSCGSSWNLPSSRRTIRAAPNPVTDPGFSVMALDSERTAAAAA